MSTRTAVADAVVIGGGVTGCSIAYHLARAGLSNVVLVEREAWRRGQRGFAPGESANSWRRLHRQDIDLEEIFSRLPEE